MVDSVKRSSPEFGLIKKDMAVEPTAADAVDAVVFLDVDGVLTTATNKNTLDDACFLRMAGLMERLKAAGRTPGIVLSTNWRRVDVLSKELHRWLQKHRLDVYVIGGTPQIEPRPKEFLETRRAQEIIAWIEANDYTGRYVAFDDLVLNLVHAIVTEAPLGLTDADVEQAFLILTAPS